MSTPPLAGAGMPPGAFSGTQAQAAREVNTASLCRIGQETVQDIVFRTMEIFQLLRNMQLPNGVTYHTATYQDRLAKLQEHLRQLSILFRKLRLVYDKCNENCAGLDPVPIETGRSSKEMFYFECYLIFPSERVFFQEHIAAPLLLYGLQMYNLFHMLKKMAPSTMIVVLQVSFVLLVKREGKSWK
ncbi:mediator of RNA polymerase II transcription subunit 30 isoform X1 [Corvus cornix cornix]|uniref:mediator of RNA polymerase II transcription subunit 30 isoform X1 n=1 Tax=Corvus cornix cornix TaxID=932674 RepID=UPI000534378C|nr:mediator of RNA polymerase II transcription subunit 30 isoform X1 [Corvus cornix cornix]XP_039405353.1 mediator of RNA polymerase II transcription subunit 30 isoform X1 [Corvus cornix cornix]